MVTVIAIRTKFYVISLFGRLNNIVWSMKMYFFFFIRFVFFSFSFWINGTVWCALHSKYYYIYCVLAKHLTDLSPALYSFRGVLFLFRCSSITIKRNNLNMYVRVQSVDTKRHSFPHFYFIFHIFFCRFFNSLFPHILFFVTEETIYPFIHPFVALHSMCAPLFVCASIQSVYCVWCVWLCVL